MTEAVHGSVSSRDSVLDQGVMLEGSGVVSMCVCVCGGGGGWLLM